MIAAYVAKTGANVLIDFRGHDVNAAGCACLG